MTAVAVWGLGQHARRTIIPGIEASKRCELVAVHTRNQGVLAEVAEDTGARGYLNADDLLGSADIDAVVVATTTGSHAEVGHRVIGAGKHLWCEKPLTTSLADTEALLEASAEAGVAVREVDAFLHHPQFAGLAEVVRSGEHGSLRSLTARFGFPHLDPADFRYSAEDGGGALLDAGFYPVAAAVGLLGDELVIDAAELEHERGVDIGGTALGVSNAAALLDWGFGRAYRSEINLWFDDAVVTADRAFNKPADLETTIVARFSDGSSSEQRVAPADGFANMFDAFAAATESDPAILARARLLDQIRAQGK